MIDLTPELAADPKITLAVGILALMVPSGAHGTLSALLSCCYTRGRVDATEASFDKALGVLGRSALEKDGSGR